MGIQLKDFVIFPCTGGIKRLNNPKTKSVFPCQFQVTFHVYLDIGTDDGDDYDDGESSDKDFYE